MERIYERTMKTYVLSYFINAGIGLVFGFLVGTVLSIGLRIDFIVALALSVGCAVVLGVVATNLYHLYFKYCLSLDINAVCEGDGMENESSLLAAVLSALTFGIYGVYWNYKLAQRLRANAPRYGFKMTESGKDIAVLSVFSFGLISTYELIKNMNRIAKVYNQYEVTAAIGGGQK